MSKSVFIEQKLSLHLDEAMGSSVSPEREELLKEKMKNLLGMLMGCQQEIAAIDTKIKLETEFLMEEERKGQHKPDTLGLLSQFHLVCSCCL